jgi:hypothetical protein
MINEISRYVELQNDAISIESLEKLAVKPPQELLDLIHDGSF